MTFIDFSAFFVFSILKLVFFFIINSFFNNFVKKLLRVSLVFYRVIYLRELEDCWFSLFELFFFSLFIAVDVLICNLNIFEDFFYIIVNLTGRVDTEMGKTNYDLDVFFAKSAYWLEFFYFWTCYTGYFLLLEFS